MKQTKLISLLLVLCMVVALLVPGTVAMEAKAADGEENDGLVVNKTAETNPDGTYTITLEAYATGESTTISTSKDKPTDIILVLDQSGSMADSMRVYSFREYSNRSNGDLYAQRHNEGSENLYYQLEDGSYAAVSVTYEDKAFTYTEITNGKNNSTQGEATNYYSNRENLYAKVNGEYLKVTLNRDWDWGTFTYTYTYTLPDGTEIASSRGDRTSPTFSGIDGNSLYLRSVDKSRTEYTYSYVVDGIVQVVEVSVGENMIPENTFYERYDSGRVTRLAALKSAVTAFANSVYAKAAGSDQSLGTGDDVDHRVAVVGFASRHDSNNRWRNTELFIGSNQYNYNQNASQYYNSALQDMSTVGGYNNVLASVGALAADGATYPNYGLEMALGILQQSSTDEDRNKVVILFTDGVPGRSGYEDGIAQATISVSQQLKALGAAVYSVGIFNGADATSTGDQDGTEIQKANWFMQNVSSNGGTPQSPSYYLSAADAGTLSSIFQQIAGSIESGGTTVTLDENSVIRDVVSPYFKLPDGAAPENISLSLVPYTGENQWGKSEEAAGVTAEIGGTDHKNISVTGFDFSENWCGPRTVDGSTTYDGKKLIISFVVETEPGFLGGNDVPTNASAGIYADSSAGEPVKVFPEPTVNVPIKEITVTAEDKNVYLLGDVTNAQLMQNATVTAGTEENKITIDPSAANYGLEPWQYAYVNIETSLTDGNDAALTDGFTGLKEDTAYNLTVTVSPKTKGTDSNGTPAEEETGEKTANVNVFKPEITWKDSEKNIGDIPDYETDNFDSLNWIHATETYDADKMIGEAPTLTYTYDPEASALTQETPVKVTVKIGETVVNAFTTFVHEPCNVEGCSFDKDECEFIVHVKSFDLTIKKSGCDTKLDPHQTFVFTVTGPNGFSMEVVIEGNGSTTITNLPAGDYTVTEDTGWSWRYSPSNSSQTVTADSISDGKANVEFVNTRDDDHWLDGNAYCENKFTGIPATK